MAALDFYYLYDQVNPALGGHRQVLTSGTPLTPVEHIRGKDQRAGIASAAAVGSVGEEGLLADPGDADDATASLAEAALEAPEKFPGCWFYLVTRG